MFTACFNLILISFSVCTQMKSISTNTMRCTVRYTFEVCDKSFQIQDENVVMGILIVEEKKVHCKGFVWLFGNVNHHQTCSLDSVNKTDS